MELVPEGFVCPLDNQSKYQGMLGNFCWCRGKVAAAHLVALGYNEDAGTMYSDLNVEEAETFGSRLRQIHNEVAEAYADGDKPVVGRTGAVRIDLATGSVEQSKPAEFDEALDSILDAARWYHAVADVGSGVRAWS